MERVAQHGANSRAANTARKEAGINVEEGLSGSQRLQARQRKRVKAAEIEREATEGDGTAADKASNGRPAEGHP